MSEKIAGRAGEVLKFGLGARNWLLTHMEGTDEQFTWGPPEGGRSAKELVDHITWVILASCSHLSETVEIELDMSEPKQVSGVLQQLSEDVKSAYNVYKKFCGKLNDEILDTVTKVPPPARLHESSVETILRIMTGY
ncbi:MAG: DinB family protein, partial [Candidatus Thorarchaeota archaeon]